MLQVALREFVGVEVQVVGHGLDIENSQVHSARGAAAAMAAALAGEGQALCVP